MMEQSIAPAWLGIGILALLALGLALLGLIVVVTVLIASGRSSAFSRQLKSVGLIVLLVVPALAVVGLVGAGLTTAKVASYRSRQGRDVPVHESVTIRHETVDGRQSSREMAADGFVYRMNVKPATGRSSASTSSTEAIQVVQTGPPQPNTTEKPAAEKPETGSSPDQLAPSSKSVPAAPATAEANDPLANPHDAAAALSGIELARPLTGVLKARQTVTREPEWTSASPLPGNSGVLVPLSSQRFATLAEAEQHLTQLATGYVKNFYRDEYPLPGEWNVPVALIEKHAVNELVGEEIDKDFGNGIKGKMYRAHVRLDLNSALRQALHESWHDQIVMHRLTLLGTGLGLVTVMLAASAGYFRLNDMTNGQYRGRLKLAAAALLGAAGLGVLAIS